MSRHKVIFVSVLFAVAAQAQQPATRRSERRPSYEAVANLLGPVHGDDPRDLERCVDLAAKLQADPRLFPFDVQVQVNQMGPGLVGYVLFREQRQPIFELIRAAASVEVWDKVTSGSIVQGWQYALVTSERAAIRSKPQADSEMTTQVSAGDPLFLLEQRGEFFRCLGPEGYCGFIQSSEFRRIDAAQLTATLNSKPAGDGFEPAIEKAMSLRGVRYVWGGTTAAGIDCSGLVQTSFKTIGINLPRDADQQVYAGRLVATRWHRDALRRGDLLFFVGRRGTINHVAIYLGDQRYIEAAGENVHISSFDPKDERYGARHVAGFAFGKRVLD
jgi:NlpC/P60 family protein/dipeptidyl peptidase-like protein